MPRTRLSKRIFPERQMAIPVQTRGNAQGVHPSIGVLCAVASGCHSKDCRQHHTRACQRPDVSERLDGTDHCGSVSCSPAVSCRCSRISVRESCHQLQHVAAQRRTNLPIAISLYQSRQPIRLKTSLRRGWYVPNVESKSALPRVNFAGITKNGLAGCNIAGNIRRQAVGNTHGLSFFSTTLPTMFQKRQSFLSSNSPQHNDGQLRLAQANLN